MSVIEYQKKLVIDYGIKGLVFAAKEANREEALSNLRKSVESICRIVILNEFGETEGLSFLDGNIDMYKRALEKKEKPSLYNLISCIKELNLLPLEISKSLDFIRQSGGNKASHSPLLESRVVESSDLRKCIDHYKNVIEAVWSDVLPSKFQMALRGEIESIYQLDLQNDIWNNIQMECNYFSKESRYVLISPPSFSDVTLNQLKCLASIKWNFIIDFNPDSKENGLYKAFLDKVLQQNIYPITIKQKSEKGIVGTSYLSLNWLFANGIRAINDSICLNKREWNRKYISFIKSLIEDYISEQTHLYTLIFMWDEVAYIRSIIETFDETITNTNRVKYVLLSATEESKIELEQEFEDYNIRVFCISQVSFIEGIKQSILLDIDNDASVFSIPCNDGNEGIKYKDLDKLYYSLLDRGLSTVYKGIELSSNTQNLDEYSFYKGGGITWKELSDEIDVRRNKRSALENRIQSFLERPKGGYIVDLQHKSGSGGSTMGLRAAFDFHMQYPTVIINGYKRNKTENAIFEIAEFSQRPVLAIVESSMVSRAELLKLVSQVNRDKKHVVFLYIYRVFNENSDSNGSIFLADYMLDVAERNRFITHYSGIISDPTSKQKISNLSNYSPQECEIIDFGLTAFDKDFSKDRVCEYLWSYLEKLPHNQLQFAGFVSIIYYYTQKRTSELWFESLFVDNSLNRELVLLPKEKRFFLKIFTRDYNIDNYEFEREWRPRFGSFSEYIIKLVLCGKNGGNNDNWKDFLSNWSIDLIKYIKENNEELTDDIRGMLMSLFFNREDGDDLDLEINSNIFNRKFAKILLDIADKDSQLLIFKKLTESYPLEAHFWGHLGRFMYENAQTEDEYDEADQIICKSLELQEFDSDLWHIKGTCSYKKCRFIIKRNQISETESGFSEVELLIQDLVEQASYDYQKSREYDNANLYAYASHIQMLIDVITWREQCASCKITTFLTDTRFYWYEDQLNKIFELVDNANYILESFLDIIQGQSLKKSQSIISSCEGRVFALIGDFTKAIDQFRLLSASSERQFRPYFRRLYVLSTLASKVNNRHKEFDNAWTKLSDVELKSIKKTLEDNIREEPTNPIHIKLWLKAGRYSNNGFKLDEALPLVKMWYDYSKDLSKLEATYYMYILYACKAINDGSISGSINAQYAKEYIAECTQYATNDRYSFEWFGCGTELKQIVHHSKLGKMSSSNKFFEDVSLLKEVEGIIISISNRRVGRIALECGLEAFFVPANGNFSDRDITLPVKFYLGFRQDGLVAWDVKRKLNNDLEQIQDVEEKEQVEDIEIQNFDDFEEEKDIKSIEPIKADVEPEIYKTESESQLPVKLKIVGKIDLSTIRKK